MFRRYNRSSGILFSSDNLREVFSNKISLIKDEVEKIDAIQLQNTSITDLCNFFEEEHTLNTPSLLVDDWVLDVQESTDASVGQIYRVEIPFLGDRDLFYASPSYQINNIRGFIEGQTIILIFTVEDEDQGEELKFLINTEIEKINQQLSHMRRDVDEFNKSIKLEAEEYIKDRKNRIQLSQNRIQSIGIPLKKRDDPQSQVYLPLKKKTIPVIPKTKGEEFQPEPAIEMNNYEALLLSIQLMAVIIERSPNTYRKLDEEDIRNIILVNLNNIYERGATGETFNGNGKTDILIQSKERNVFIAECKFWKGPKVYLSAINQLLSYKVWRDTKTAILIFAREAAMSTVLSKIEIETPLHPNFVRKIPWNHESGFRYIFNHAGDPNREFTLSVMVFDVPGESNNVQ